MSFHEVGCCLLEVSVQGAVLSLFSSFSCSRLQDEAFTSCCFSSAVPSSFNLLLHFLSCCLNKFPALFGCTFLTKGFFSVFLPLARIESFFSSVPGVWIISEVFLCLMVPLLPLLQLLYRAWQSSQFSLSEKWCTAFFGLCSLKVFCIVLIPRRLA